VIEDCAQAHGGLYRGSPLGSIGHAAAFSFCQDKIITTGGEGGLLVLDDEAAYRRAWEFKDHGKSFDKARDPASAPGSNFKWLHDSFGTNWRLTEMQAAIGRVALRALPRWTAERRRNALQLAEGLAPLAGVRMPLPADPAEHAFYRFYGRVESSALAAGWNRDRVIAAVAAEGVPCMYGSCAEVYREQAFVRAGLAPAQRLPGASTVDAETICFLVHPTLSSCCTR